MNFVFISHVDYLTWLLSQFLPQDRVSEFAQVKFHVHLPQSALVLMIIYPLHFRCNLPNFLWKQSVLPVTLNF